MVPSPEYTQMIRRSFLAFSLAFAACSGSKVDSVAPALTGLTLSAGTLNPSFDPAVHDYSAVVPFGTLNLAITPAGESGSTVTVEQDGQAVSGGVLAVPARGSQSVVQVAVARN